MSALNVKAVFGLLLVLVVMGVLLFGFAGTLRFGEAWVFLAVFGGAALAITLYLMRYDPQLLARRVYGGPTAEKQRSQQVIQGITATAFVAMLVVPALDHRWHWSTMPLAILVVGEAIVLSGFLVIFLVYRENSFASAIIEVAPGQKVVSSGPYALVRHPMYFGGLLMFVGVPLSLASWWGLTAVCLMVPALIWRLQDEERFLVVHLPGYTDYQGIVHGRLIPGIW
jgi:protein-S-isoprenylcysteine O-methyltransferase Ste14